MANGFSNAGTHSSKDAKQSLLAADSKVRDGYGAVEPADNIDSIDRRSPSPTLPAEDDKLVQAGDMTKMTLLSGVPVLNAGASSVAVPPPTGNASDSKTVVSMPTARPANKLTAFFDWTGAVLTFLAMIPQGLLGGLLAYIFVKDRKWFASAAAEEIVSLVALALFGIASFEGKRRLVRFFNTGDFKALAELKRDDFDFSNYSLKDILLGMVNTYAIYNASKTFAGLSFLALQSISDDVLRSEYFQWDKAAAVIEHPAFAAPFAAAALLANLVAFRGIQRYGISFIVSGMKYMLENPAYRREREKLQQKIAFFRMVLRNHAESGEWKEYNEFIEELVSTKKSGQKLILFYQAQQVISLRDINIDELRHNIVATQLPNYIPRELQSWRMFFLEHFTAATSSIVAVIGLYNFMAITEAVNDFFHMTVMNLVDSPLDYGSMILLAVISVYPFVSSLFKNARALDFSTTKQYAWHITFALVACGIGGMPNGAQSYLVGEKLYMIILALLSSFLNEMGGFLSLTTNNNNEAICANDPRKATARDNDGYLIRAEDLFEADEEKVHTLMDAAEMFTQVTVESKRTEGKRAKPRKWRMWAEPQGEKGYQRLSEQPSSAAVTAIASAATPAFKNG